MLLGVEDQYTAYCIDEACALILVHLKNKEEPKFHTEYTNFSDFYAKFD